MALLPILWAPDPILKSKCESVKTVDDDVRRLMDDMLETMYDAAGIGLAAPQIGRDLRVIVVDCSKRDGISHPIKMANPEILARSDEEETVEEGCLSLPDLYGKVTRPAEVKISYLDETGTPQELVASGLLATCIQHEIDHLNGVLFIDHLSALKRNMILRKMVKAKKESTQGRRGDPGAQMISTQAIATPAERSGPRLRIAFMGTPDFALPTLQALIEAGHDVCAVYTQPPRPAGRGKRVQKSPVQRVAEASAIPVHSPTNLKDPSAQAEFAALNLDLAVVVAYGLILPEAVLQAPRLGCVNVHASLLPRWRGAAPIQRAIMAGDTETGVSIMCMDAGLDTGPILSTMRVPITPETTGESLHNALADLGGEAILPAIMGLADGSLHPEPQAAQGATYARKLMPEDGRLAWQLSATELDRLVRACTPRPGAWCQLNGARLKVLAAEICPPDAPGTATDTPLTIACGDGALRLTRVQMEGRAALDADAFLRGNRMHRQRALSEIT